MVSPRVFSPLARLTILGLCLLWPRSGRRPRATPAPTPLSGVGFFVETCLNKEQFPDKHLISLRNSYAYQLVLV